MTATKEFNLTDFKGNNYKGSNIRDFCRKQGLNYTSMIKLVKGDAKTSQGFYRTDNYHIIPNYIIVNIRTKEVFKTNSIYNWCKENQPQLLSKGTGCNRLHKVLKGITTICDKEWWVCEEKNWQGYIEINTKSIVNSMVYTVTNNVGEIYEINNTVNFCKESNLNLNSFYNMLRGNIATSEGYVLLKRESIFKNANIDGTRIQIL